MVWIQKNLSNLFADGGPPRLAGDLTGDAFTSQVSFQTPDLGCLPAPLHALKGNKKGQNEKPPTVK